MSNYVYIISSLPVISSDAKSAEGLDTDAVIEEIREQLGESDNALLDTLTQGFVPDNLTADFYAKAVKSADRFIREYFLFDLNVRNAKAEYLNKAFGRPAGQDTICLSEDGNGEFEQADELDAILGKDDLIAREKGLDDLTWAKIEELVTFNYFDMDCILAFVARLNIIQRWLRLDEKTGREMFRKLVGDVRSTFKGVEFEK